MHFKFLIFCSLGLLLWACGPKPPFVRAPFEGVANVSIEQSFRAEEGGIMRMGNGTEVHIPENAFVDMDGKPVNGDVTVSFIELGDPTAMLISGIPLHYGGTDDPKIMESAGMFDLSAAANGQPVEVAPGKSIRTILSSNEEGDQYDFFRLDEAGRTWEPLGSVAPAPNPAIARLDTSITLGMEKVLDYDVENCFAFNYGEDLDIVVDEERYKLKDQRFNYYTWDMPPALQTLNKLLRTKLQDYGVNAFLKERSWQEVTWKGRKYNPNLLLWQAEKALPSWIVSSKKYRGPKLTKLRGDRYRLQFIRSEYDDGWKEYVDFTTYITPKMTLEALYTEPAEARSQAYETLLAQVEQDKETLAAQNNVLREFNITQMGVYNYDYIKAEERLLVEAELYLDGEPMEDQLTDLFVVIKDQNAVMRYNEHGLASFVIYPGQQLFAFMVSEGNAIAMQQAGALDDIDISTFRSNPNQKLSIDLQTSKYVIREPADLSLFLDREMRGLNRQEMLSMH